MIRVLVKNVYEFEKVDYIEEGLEPLQKIVDGLIERVYVEELEKRNIILYANEDGLYRNLEPNVFMVDKESKRVVNVLVGNLVFVGTDNKGNDISLTTEQVKYIQDSIFKNLGWITNEKDQSDLYPIINI